MDVEQLLEEKFGHTTFREGQKEVIEILLSGRSSLAVFPTGGGKSLCYQLPALLMDGLTLVVSPLIALMKDQVESLHRNQIAAARLDSTLEAHESRAITQQMLSGELKLLYVAPERLANEGFLRTLRKTNISMLAIDEAHCISEWGHNFRPDYLKLAGLAKNLKIDRVLALTATATPRVSADIRNSFSIEETDHIQTGFERSNLQFHATPVPAEDRKELLLQRIGERPKGPTVVYVTLQRTAEEVSGFLASNGLNARSYHAGMRDDHRAEVQDDFMADNIDIVVATIAFGMGIDKSNIRYVYHYNLPKSLENYVQESGRAGRDGETSVCEILACGDDRIVLQNFVFGDTPSPSALRSLVEHLALQGNDFSISRYDISISKDIRPLVVATVLTYLELEELLFPTGPFYAGYQFQFLQPREKVLAGHTPERQEFLNQLFDASKKARIWFTVDISEVAAKLNEPEERIRKALSYLEELGDLRTKPARLRHGYRLNPDAPIDVSEITSQLVELFSRREQGEIERVQRVIDLCCSSDCIPRQLLHYFGEEMENCGTCGNCKSEEAKSSNALPVSNSGTLDASQVELIHNVISESHTSLRQPRQLTRFLCGISSPAASRARLYRDERFGALDEVPFQVVLAQAESIVIT